MTNLNPKNPTTWNFHFSLFHYVKKSSQFCLSLLKVVYFSSINEILGRNTMKVPALNWYLNDLFPLFSSTDLKAESDLISFKQFLCSSLGCGIRKITWIQNTEIYSFYFIARMKMYKYILVCWMAPIYNLTIMSDLDKTQ